MTDLARGDAVALVFVPSCGHCAPCQEGWPALYEPGAAANGAGTLVGGHRDAGAAGRSGAQSSGRVSCVAEYAVVNRGSLVKVRSDLPPEVAGGLRLCGTDGVGAALNWRRCVSDRRSQWSVSAA